MTTKSFLGFVTDRTETPSRITRGFPAGGQVPHPHRRIPAAADHDRAAVQLTDGHRGDPAGVAGERVAERVTAAQVPHPNRRW